MVNGGDEVKPEQQFDPANDLTGFTIKSATTYNNDLYNKILTLTNR
jgi:hypothetical protein